ncbi:MAG: MBL fold metallo-hydrolase [Candidatus Micrarchaeia archaeon]|jgi:L-ascorbate metabolism protein UlaG (beta-lactamase superfamily)
MFSGKLKLKGVGMAFEFVKWIGHAAFLLEGEQRIYIDPYKLSRNFGHADIIFITHSHYDHLSLDDIRKVADPETVIVAPAEAKGKLIGFDTQLVEPLKEYSIKGVDFDTVPAYNVKKERLNFHPKANNWVGYIININGKRIYHAGDTDKIEEMKDVKCDLALLPMGGTYTMDINEAIEATKLIKAAYFAPMHYKILLGKEGSVEAEKKFSSLVKNSIIFKEVQEPSYSF